MKVDRGNYPFEPCSQGEVVGLGSTNAYFAENNITWDEQQFQPAPDFWALSSGYRLTAERRVLERSSVRLRRRERGHGPLGNLERPPPFLGHMNHLSDRDPHRVPTEPAGLHAQRSDPC